jgi:hypothetical protein
MATYADGNTNTWSVKIWAWNTDYATTVAGTPLYIATGENHNDNQDFVVDVPVKLLISGDVYYEVEYLTGDKSFTPWTAGSVLVEGVESYVNGELKEGTYASSVVVGVEAEEPVIPEKPENGSLELPLTVTETLNATSVWKTVRQLTFSTIPPVLLPKSVRVVATTPTFTSPTVKTPC